MSFVPARLLLISAPTQMRKRKRDTYRIVAVSLYAHEAGEADRLTDVLKRAGWPKANRSLIVREALLRLEQDVAGKDDEGVFRYFVERQARRLGASRAAPPAPQPTRTDPDATTARAAPRDLLDLVDRKS